MSPWSPPTLVDARSNRHSFTYSDVGQETQRIDPLNRRTTFGYDAAGQQTLRIDARSNRTSFVFDDNGQLTIRKYPDASRATFAYDETGNRTLMADSTGRYSFSYDGSGNRIVAENPNSKTITYAWDPVGNRAHMDAPNSGRFTYSYDEANQIAWLHNPFGERTTFTNDAVGRRTLQKNANGTRASYIYDGASNLTTLHNLKSDNSMISSFDYRYDSAGNRVAVGEANGDRVTWTYDDTNQLLSEHRSEANAFRNTFTYDAVGNRLVLNDDGTRTTSVFDAANQIKHSEAAAGRTTYTFDADGNQQIVEEPSGDRTTNVWDYENRLTSVQLPSGGRSTSTYQADNLRVTANDGTSSRSWLWDDQNYLSQTDGGVLVFTNEPQYYGNLVSQHDGTDTHWYHFDARGDTRELTSGSESTTDTRLYDAWGNIISSTGITPMLFQFVGKLGYAFDATLNLNYVRARWYGAGIGRWLSVDPFEHSDWRSQYVYSLNDPLAKYDPSGLLSVTPVMKLNIGDAECGDDVAIAWRFWFPNGAPCTGVLFQRVYVWCNVSPCSRWRAHQDRVYIESWRVTKGQKDVNAEFLSGGENSWTDMAGFTAVDTESRGYYGQVSEIRLFCERGHDDNTALSPGETVSKQQLDQMMRDKSVEVLRGQCQTSSIALPGRTLGNNYYPSFWDRNAKSVGAASRYFAVSWKCCCVGDSYVRSFAIPADGGIVVDSIERFLGSPSN